MQRILISTRAAASPLTPEAIWRLLTLLEVAGTGRRSDNASGQVSLRCGDLGPVVIAAFH